MALHNIDIRTLWPIFNKIYGTVFGIYKFVSVTVHQNGRPALCMPFLHVYEHWIGSLWYTGACQLMTCSSAGLVSSRCCWIRTLWGAQCRVQRWR